MVVRDEIKEKRLEFDRLLHEFELLLHDPIVVEIDDIEVDEESVLGACDGFTFTVPKREDFRPGLQLPGDGRTTRRSSRGRTRSSSTIAEPS